MKTSRKRILQAFYEKLYRRFGPQRWWPGDTVFEIIVGAILTQNTSWSNVEKAVANLKEARRLAPRALAALDVRELAELIRPSGYFNVKAVRLKNFTDFLNREYAGDLAKMAATPAGILRARLLAVNGIGPETADSILLYAFQKPVFVVDTYTRRILLRHNLIDPDADYQQIQGLFHAGFPPDTKLYNEYHALIVRVAKEFCHTRPDCENCPLNTVNYSLLERCAECFRYLPGNKTGQEREARKKARQSRLQQRCRNCRA